ncbi:MAG TPA: class I SAM-dependent methyltransferase [Burkholderiaceae bacterium]|nr:class I SAM-dependent methyltransferase [Burkholderiaceae bacterium]
MLDQFSHILLNPADGGALSVRDGVLVATEADHRVPVTDGIPNLYVDVDPLTGASVNAVSETVKRFYEETPFPNYDDLDSRWSLQTKAQAGIYAKLLDQQLPDGALVWEAGCGTGQLSNFLGMSYRRRVFAGDLCLNSLRLGKQFADRNAIRNVCFVQANLFRPPFKDAVFDVVISNGVLHHTADCEGAFRSILTKLKPGGTILIGLYNYYARLPTLWKRWAFEHFGKSLHFLDPRLRAPHMNSSRVNAWFMDQYQHPHETRHSMDEVLHWFDRYGVDFVNGVPHLDGSDFSSAERLLEPKARGTVVSRVATQLNMLAGGGKDGGLFIMIGKKR